MTISKLVNSSGLGKGHFARYFRKATSWLSQADGLLNDLHRAKESGPMGMALGAASAAARIIEHLLPSPSAEEQVKELGWIPVRTGIAGFLANALFKSDLPRKVVLIEEEQVTKRLLVFSGRDSGRGTQDGQEVAALLCNKDQILVGPYTRGTSEAVDSLRKLLASISWTSGDLSLDTSRGGGSLQGSDTYGDQHEDEGGSFALTEMPKVGVYFGAPEVSYYVERLKKHFAAVPGGTRSILLIGPSGVGKSTLGRLIGSELAQGAKTLKISAKAVKRLTAVDLADLTFFLAPEVLLIDDVKNILPHSEYDTCETALDLLESLRGKAKLVILTLMDDHESYGASAKTYLAGMRPGRIDEVFYIKKPTVPVIRDILKHYLVGANGEAGATGGATGGDSELFNSVVFSDIVKRCKKAGFTGAYLAEVALRIRIHGIQNYVKEIENIALTAPKVHKKPRWETKKKRKPKRAKGVVVKRFKKTKAGIKAGNKHLGSKAT